MYEMLLKYNNYKNEYRFIREDIFYAPFIFSWAGILIWSFTDLNIQYLINVPTFIKKYCFIILSILAIGHYIIAIGLFCYDKKTNKKFFGKVSYYDYSLFSMPVIASIVGLTVLIRILSHVLTHLELLKAILGLFICGTIVGCIIGLFLNREKYGEKYAITIVFSISLIIGSVVLAMSVPELKLPNITVYKWIIVIYESILYMIIKAFPFCLIFNLITGLWTLITTGVYKWLDLNYNNQMLNFHNMEWQTIIFHRLSNMIFDIQSDAGDFELAFPYSDNINLNNADKKELIEVIKNYRTITKALIDDIDLFDSVLMKIQSTMDNKFYNKITWKKNCRIEDIIYEALEYCDLPNDEINISKLVDYTTNYNLFFNEQAMIDVFKELMINADIYKKAESPITIWTDIVNNNYIPDICSDIFYEIANSKIIKQKKEGHYLLVVISNILGDDSNKNIESIGLKIKRMNHFWRNHLIEKKTFNDIKKLDELPFGLTFIIYYLLNMECFANCMLSSKDENNEIRFYWSILIPLYEKSEV